MQKMLFLLSGLAVILWSSQVSAFTLSVDSALDYDVSINGTSVEVDVTVANATEAAAIAGAAFTVTYDTNALTLTNVASTFFDTFAAQFGAVVPVPNPFPDTEVVVDNETYTRPLLTNDITGGTMIAAARVEAGDTNTTLFTLTFNASNAINGIDYTVNIVPSVISNTAAGYDSNGETIPLLVGDTGNDNLSLAFPPLVTAESISAQTDTVNAGTIRVSNGANNNQLGDADGSGTVDSTDALYILHYVAGNITLDQLISSVCDVDHSGVIDSTDALYILHYVAGNVGSL